MHVGSTTSSSHSIFSKRKNVTFESRTAKPPKQLKMSSQAISNEEAKKVNTLTKKLEFSLENIKMVSVLAYASEILLIDPFNYDVRSNRITASISKMEFDRALCDVLVLRKNILAAGENISWKKIAETNKSSAVLKALTLHIHVLIYMGKLKKVPPKISLLKTLPDHEIFIDQIMMEYSQASLLTRS